MKKYESPIIAPVFVDVENMDITAGCFTKDTTCGHGDAGCGGRPPWKAGSCITLDVVEAKSTEEMYKKAA